MKLARFRKPGVYIGTCVSDEVGAVTVLSGRHWRMRLRLEKSMGTGTTVLGTGTNSRRCQLYVAMKRRPMWPMCQSTLFASRSGKAAYKSHRSEGDARMPREFRALVHFGENAMQD